MTIEFPARAGESPAAAAVAGSKTVGPQAEFAITTSETPCSVSKASAVLGVAAAKVDGIAMTQIRIQYEPPPAPPPDPYAERSREQPLTHHEILSIIAPFTRRGFQADLAASDRSARRLVFKPREHLWDEDGATPLREVLSLELAAKGKHRLTRTVTDPAGATAVLAASGDDLERLVDQVVRVPVDRHYRVYDGVAVLRSYRLDLGAADDAGGPALPALSEARARIDRVNVAIKLDKVRGMPVEVKLTADPGETLRIPEDLLAVLGWHWRPCLHFVSYWRGTIRVPSTEPKRTADVELKIRQTVSHLAKTLSAPPSRFHPRHGKARWRVTFQRAIPLLTGLAILAATPAVRLLDMDENSVLRMLIFHAPPMMLVGFFMLREMPRIEIPPVPRPLRGDAWVVDAGSGKVSAQPVKATQS